MIVVVEDHDDIRGYLATFLIRLGAKVVEAKNAFEGLQAVKTYRPDIVLSDIVMPGRDGFGLLGEIRGQGPDAGGDVPVIAMTALVTHADRARILNAGFKACLPKPFGPDKLVETILTALEGYVIFSEVLQETALRAQSLWSAAIQIHWLRCGPAPSRRINER
jgi:two-component system, chemotaxis family, CheB/CheR fusion protein